MGVGRILSVSRPQILSSTSVIRRRPLQCLVWLLFFILYIHYISRRPSLELTAPQKPPPLDDIPTKIWQVFFNYTSIDPYTDSMQTWIAKCQDYQYTLVSSVGANAFALKHYANRREILYPFFSLRNPVLRSHLFRYMLLESEGGIYSDLDIAALKPAKEWIPPHLKSRVRAIVGIEYDHGAGEASPGVDRPRLQFCQWTIAASRGHPLMSRVVADTVDALRALAIDNDTMVAEPRSSDEEVMRFNGQGVWTRAVLKTLSEATGTEVGWRNLTGMRESRVFGDVMVLPVGAFGMAPMGRMREGRGRDGEAQALVRRVEQMTD
ncbi:hypothetical protein IMSHALPRED_010576 [Imshaugia aleurites]|uniref:Initiation-specific alpha-1,6-mannosyltransferase n=1 Tax=Imshaugia aleurites TaxID=172621 RepID=A0A8H3ES96_9LECA|nr:hypothetical protein IMSHALPRED_010576 [Imshaugia aleurites]